MTLKVDIDNANAIEFPDLDIALMAIEDKIIVMIDSWKSGFECKDCKGTGKVGSFINPELVRSCDTCKGTGATLHIPDSHKSLPSTGVIVSMGPLTPYCQIKKMIANWKKQAERDLKNSVVYADIDERIQEAEAELQGCLMQIGTRIVFNVHVGTFLPIKSESRVRLKIMRVTDPMCIVFGTGNSTEKNLLDPTLSEFGA
jgi:hypothetical protein